jgi:hypothetical protein
MANQFIQPNTRSGDWKETLLTTVEEKKVFLVEPDKIVVDFLTEEGKKFLQ